MTSAPFLAYSPHPSQAREASFEASLLSRTGRSVEDWVALIRAEALPGRREVRGWLASDHGMTRDYAAWLAGRAEGVAMIGGDALALVEAMYASKPGLRPVHETLVAAALRLGPDVRVVACSTIVPLYRRRVFAQIKPATRSRIDLGLALGDRPAEGPLIATGGFEKGDRITHRIAVEAADEVVEELAAWLKLAYDRDA